MSVPTEESAGATAIRSFTVPVAPEAEIEALRARIAATRWLDQELVADQSQGVQLATIRELARYWGTDYDFRRLEARLSFLYTKGIGYALEMGLRPQTPGRSRTSSPPRCEPHSGHCVDRHPTNNGGRNE